jgi:REP element-mobilizing transposase RayT
MPSPETPNHPVRRHKRGYLPHYDSPDLVQFVTFRLAGSLPANIFESLKFRLAGKQITELEYHKEIDRALDRGHGPTHLRDQRIARLVAATMVKFDGYKYDLFSWVIMPNHAHILLRTRAPFTLSQVVHSIKGFTGNEANRILDRTGRFWSPDYFDRFMRDRVHLERVRKYIEENPVKARLCASPEEWPWGSAGWSE